MCVHIKLRHRESNNVQAEVDTLPRGVRRPCMCCASPRLPRLRAPAAPTRIPPRSLQSLRCFGHRGDVTSKTAWAVGYAESIRKKKKKKRAENLDVGTDEWIIQWKFKNLKKKLVKASRAPSRSLSSPAVCTVLKLASRNPLVQSRQGNSLNKGLFFPFALFDSAQAGCHSYGPVRTRFKASSEENNAPREAQKTAHTQLEGRTD